MNRSDDLKFFVAAVEGLATAALMRQPDNPTWLVATALTAGILVMTGHNREALVAACAGFVLYLVVAVLFP